MKIKTTSSSTTIKAKENRASTGSVKAEISGLETYKGSYTVEPDAIDQTLETANKRMAKDVTVKAVRIYEVSNQAGGDTFVAIRE